MIDRLIGYACTVLLFLGLWLSWIQYKRDRRC